MIPISQAYVDQAIIFNQAPISRVFYPVDGKSHDKIQVITDIFKRVLTPLYGPQDKAIEQIKESKDRKAFILYEDFSPKAVLVFKTVLSNEYEELGVKESIEIKSMFVDHPEVNSGKGLGSSLINKLFDEIALLPVAPKGVHVTVNNDKKDSLEFFLKKQFKIVYSWENRYVEDSIEHLLYRSLEAV